MRKTAHVLGLFIEIWGKLRFCKKKFEYERRVNTNGFDFKDNKKAIVVDSVFYNRGYRADSIIYRNVLFPKYENECGVAV